MYSWSSQRKGGHQKFPTVSREYEFNQTILKVEQKAVLTQIFHIACKFPRQFNGVTDQKMVFVVTIVGTYISLNGKKEPFFCGFKVST
jgi:hypothetical protein